MGPYSNSLCLSFILFLPMPSHSGRGHPIKNERKRESLISFYLFLTLSYKILFFKGSVYESLFL